MRQSEEWIVKNSIKEPEKKTPKNHFEEQILPCLRLLIFSGTWVDIGRHLQEYIIFSCSKFFITFTLSPQGLEHYISAYSGERHQVRCQKISLAPLTTSTPPLWAPSLLPFCISQVPASLTRSLCLSLCNTKRYKKGDIQLFGTILQQQK